MQAKEEVLLGELREGTKHVVMGAGQPEYIPLPCDVIMGKGGRLAVCRFSLTDEEREAIANGADIVHQVLIGLLYPPMNLQVVMPTENPVLIRG